MYRDMGELRNDCMNCEKCELCRTRTNLVFGGGNENSKILFIGEAPGENEDIQGEPFVGRGGKLLDSYLTAAGLDRNRNIYIANILKCRPPKNRDPLPGEQDCCINWLREQVRILNPKVIVCLGRIAACRLISSDFKVTKEHGVFFDRNGVLMMATYHPAALLRDPGRKGEALDDFMKLREKAIELGIEVL